MKLFLVFIVCALFPPVFGQFTDTFSDGNFSSNPNWIGETDRFIVNTNSQLQLFAPAVQESSFLSVACPSINNATWEFQVNMTFSPSSSSFTRVYLVSNNANLKSALNGYFVMIGDTQDEISLYKQSGTAQTEIIEGVPGSVNLSNVLVKIKVTRDAVGNWTLSRDIGATGSYLLEGSVFDNTHVQGNFFGVYCQYIASRSQMFFFDNFVVTGDPVVDNDAPILDQVTFSSNTQLELTFNEPIAATSANVSNFSVDNGIGNPVSATLSPLNSAQIILNFANPFVDNTNYLVSGENIRDLANNVAPSFNHPFLYYEFSIPQFGEIRINEVMADESPSVGQPSVEYVELMNTTSKTFQLLGYKICNDNSCGTIQTSILGANGYLIVTPTNGNQLFTGLNAINATSFPGFKNDGDEVILQNPTETLVLDEMFYDVNTYQDPLKADGGYALELINPFSPCLGADNWRATNSSNGGTPGNQNSVYNNFEDTIAPFLFSAFLISPNTLELLFNERLESNELVNLDLVVENGASILSISVEGDYTDKALLTFDQDFLPNQTYNFSIANLTDCEGNVTTIESFFVKPDSSAVGDLIINEILFNPITGGSDYVELYNRSTKFINLKNWQIANLSNGLPASLRIISSQNRIIQPYSYVVLTADSSQVKQTYVNHGFGKFISCSLPTYANSEGNVLVFNEDNLMMDSLTYDEKWHFTLIDDEKGKSLERINPSGITNDPNNWQTASETIGWGTPGILNSQYLNPQASSQFVVEPSVISPDNDGFEDFALLTYELPESGMLGSLMIYDENGRVVRELANNFYFDQQGSLKWDGLNDSGIKCRIGRYLVAFDVFSIQTGAKYFSKKAVVIAGKI